MALFQYDRLIDADQFCNYSQQIIELLAQTEKGACLRVYGPRNTGKTSLIKNIIAKRWENIDDDKRVIIYADLFGIQTSDDLSNELTKAFERGVSAKKGLIDKSRDWMKLLVRVRPTWQPDPNTGFGQFSFRTDDATGPKVVDYETVITNINALHNSGKFHFFLILDEFQEIANIPRAEGKLRNALQQLSSDIPVAILGSKFHLLQKIFAKPTAPFYNWGQVFEMGHIPFEEYTSYINERLKEVGKQIDKDASISMQNTLARNPEAINRFCDYLADTAPQSTLTVAQISLFMDRFVDVTRSTQAASYAALSESERRVVQVIARRGTVLEISGKSFLDEAKLTSRGSVLVVERLLDRSVLSRTEIDSSWRYHLTDPFFAMYVKKFVNSSI